MKLKSTLLTALLMAFFAVNANAVDEHHADDKAGKAETAPATAPAEKTEAKKPMKKHNHMEEKTGMPMSEPMQNSGKSGDMMNKHDHMKEKH